MKKRAKKILRIGGIVLAAILLAVIVFTVYVYFHKPALKGYIERTLSKRPGLTVTIGRLNYRLFPLRVEADSVKVVFISALGRADVVIGRAEAAGSFQRVLKNEKPFLDSLAVSGLKLEFNEDPNSPSSGPLNIPNVTRLVSDTMEYASEVAVRDSSFHLSLPVERMDLAASAVDIKAARGTRTSLRLTAGRFDFRNDRPVASLRAAVNLDASWARSGPFQMDGHLGLASSSVSYPDKHWQENGLGLSAGFKADEKTVTVPEFALDIPDLAALSGSGRAELGKEIKAAFASKLEVKDIERMKKSFASFLPAGLPEFKLEGRMQWEGDLRVEMAAGTPDISAKGTVRLLPARFFLKTADLSTDQTIQAELRIEGRPTNLRVEGVIEGARGEVKTGSIQARGLSYRLPVHVEGSLVKLSALTAKAVELVVSAGGRKLTIDGPSINLGAEVDYVRQSADVRSLTVDIPRLGAVNIAGNAVLGPKRQVALTVNGRNLDIAGLLKYFPDFVPAGITAWQPAGRADLSLEARNEAADPGHYKLKGTLNVAAAAFQDSTGTIVSEGLEPRLGFEADVSVPDSPRSAVPSATIPFSLQIDLAKGESLWKEAYFNWQTGPVRLELKGTFDPTMAAVREATAALSFAPLGEIRARGSLALGPKPRLDLHLDIPSIDLASAYAFLGKMRPAQSSTLEVRGKAEAEVDVRFQNSFSVRGRVRVRDAAAGQKDGSLSAAGIDVDFPFSVSNGIRPGDEKDDFSIAPGHLQAAQVKTSAATFAALRIDFLSARNLYLLFPVEVGLWGAKLDLGQSVLTISPATLAVRGVSTLALTDLDFSKLPFNTESFKLEGKASIPGNSLEITPREFRFNGRLLADLFGGRMTLDGLRVTDVFGPGRRIVFQAEIEGLDLGKLTSAVPFGDVTGIVDILLKDFALSYGQPESFAMTITSVPRKGISRKFSLKAVDNLSVISSGGPSAAPSSSFFTKLVHSFNYSRIGIACSLRNDVFRLQGTIIEGGIQYLVRRATFFGIDVVNAKPVNTISFKDMLGRLERVGQSQEKK